jgi:peptidoglycan/LPS O-acetylase OafA/YrhL
MLDDDARLALARRVPTVLALAAWIAFTAAVKTGFLSNLQPGYYFASALACGLLVLKACDPDGEIARALGRPAMRWLGRYSYSFFLIHYIVVHAWAGVAASWVGKQDGALFAAVFIAGSLGLSLLAARALYAATERFYFTARKS